MQKSQVIDRFLEDPITLANSMLNVTIVEVNKIPSRIGRLNAFQEVIREVDDGYDVIRMEIGLNDCTLDHRADLDNFWGSHELITKNLADE